VPATAGDADEVAALFARSRALALPFLPVLHTAEEDRALFSRLIAGGGVTLACEAHRLLGFMVESDGWVEHLYLDPDFHRQGIGGRLLAAAQARQDELSLWCFAQNAAALAFYGRHGFAEMRRTAGDNEERLPDVLLHWTRG